jgi:hypothetical protein
MDIRMHHDPEGLINGKVTCLVLEVFRLEIGPSFLPMGALVRDSFRAGLGGAEDRLDATLFVFGGQLRDGAGCIGISPSYIKSLRRNPHVYLQLHREALYQDGSAVPLDRKGKYLAMDTDSAIQSLPLDAFKYIQSTKMAAAIMNERFEAAIQPLNPSKNKPELREETLPQFWKRASGYDWVFPTEDGFGPYDRNPEVPKNAKSVHVTRQYERFMRKGAEHIAKRLPPALDPIRESANEQGAAGASTTLDPEEEAL